MAPTPCCARRVPLVAARPSFPTRFSIPSMQPTVAWCPPRAVTDGQLHSSSVGAVAVAPSNPDVIYIGMGETELRGNIMQGDGVYKAADAGRTWKNAGLADTQAISRIRVHPTDPNRSD